MQGLSTIQESPLTTSGFIFVGALQVGAVAGRFLPAAIVSNGWLLSLTILLITAVLFGIATLLQRLLMPSQRTTFSRGVLLAGIGVSLVSSIVVLATG